jgi:DNA topoisomerase-1
MVVKEGRFGPYVTDGETNASLRKGDEIEELTSERAAELLAERREKEAAGLVGRSRGRRVASGRSTAAKKPTRTGTAKASASKAATAKPTASKASASKASTSKASTSKARASKASESKAGPAKGGMTNASATSRSRSATAGRDEPSSSGSANPSG